MPEQNTERLVYKFLAGHALLNRLSEEDETHYIRLLQQRGKDEGVPSAFPPFAEVPTAFPHFAFSHILISAAEESGAKRADDEKAEDYLRRAFSGKAVGVLGTRYGLLQKVFEELGAKTYGIDLDKDAVAIARERGLDVKRGNATKINALFAHKKPDFIVSYQFFDPDYWWGAKADILPKILAALERHATPQTIQVHHTIVEPTAFPNFAATIKKIEIGKWITILRKKIRAGSRG